MDCSHKIRELRDIIKTTLTPLINGRPVVLADAPYYDNIGDVLIWNGISDFVSTLNIPGYKEFTSSTFQFENVDSETVILLTGGGNFGDLWRGFQQDRLNIISRYPNNRIIMLPQSVWYDDEQLIEHDAAIMRSHPDLYLCARDRSSFDFLQKENFSDKILLLPDMAFCISEERLQQYRSCAGLKKLYFLRKDKEKSSWSPELIGADYDISDWPTFEHRPIKFSMIHYAGAICRRLSALPRFQKSMVRCIDRYASSAVKKSLFQTGAEFLAPYSEIITTRLHAMILAVLLHKRVSYIDNTTGKLSSFAGTWFDDVDYVKLLE